jgi:PAS domain S-box-containing protein
VIGFLAVYHDQPHYYRKTELDLLETLAYQITAALDNAELLKALETYASEQAQLVYLSRISTASLDLDKVILSISSLLEQILNADGVQIGILVPGKDRLNLYRAHQESLNVQALRLNNVPELHALNAEPLTVLPHIYYSDDPQVSIGLRAIMREYSDTTLVVMPLVVNNALFGVVLLGNQERRVFNDSDLRLIEMAMNQITAQLYNAQQYTRTEEDLQRRLEQLALLENLAQQITSSLEPNKVIDKVLDAAITATQADVATLGLLTDSDEFWFIRRERNSQGEWVQDYEVIPKDKGVSGRVVRTGEMTIIPDNRLEPDYYPVSPRQVYLSSLTVPLRKENRLIGVLNIESVQLDFFTPQHAGFIGNLAGHAVISIDNARQMEERQHEIEMLTRLRELSLRATTASDIESVATAVLQTSFSMLNAQDAALFSYNMNTDEITLLAGVRYDQNQRVELHETLIRGKLAYRIARDGNMDFIQDLRQYPPYEFVDTREYISLLGIPVKRARQICEVLCLAFTAPQDFERRERSSLDLLSIQAASHLENALLNGEIRSASNRMRAILDSTRDGVILLDGDGVLIDYNPSAERLLGITLDDEQPSRRLAEMLMTQSTAGEMGEGGYSPTEIATLARILKEEPDRITRRQFARYVQGQFTYIEEIGSPVKDSNNVTIGRLLVLRDVTEEKMLEAYRDEITHMIVHDLRSPLGSIISALTLAMESVGEPDTAYMVAPTLEVSLTSAYKLLRLVDSLLDIAKLETRQMPLKFGPGKVDKMVTEAYITLSSSILAANLTVDIEVSPDLPPVYVDTDKITRVVINLLDNAIRYAPVNGRILIHAQFLEQRKRILVQIADSGIGIPPEERERVFDKFATQVQKGKGPERGPKGSGLGLTFCKLAIEAHGERIWVESESPLSGACFAFTLPIVTESATNPTPTPTAEVQS